MKVESVDIPNIDLTDQTFLIGDPTPDTSLKESIQSLGQITPIILASKEKNFIIVTGWKRS